MIGNMISLIYPKNFVKEKCITFIHVETIKIKESSSREVIRFNMIQVTNTPHFISPPEAGFIFKSKLSL